MPSLTFNRYGKTQVRLTQVLRDGGSHEVVELSVSILFEGDFTESYTAADNSKVLPTDTMKNAVYVVARRHPIVSVEQFARDLGRHFLDRLQHLERVEIEIEQKPWARIREHGSAFMLAGDNRRIATVDLTRQEERIHSGFRNLEILKTAHSAFAGFLKDDLTTLPETRDRLLGTTLDASWTYRSGNIDFNSIYDRARAALLDAFANHTSQSVQHTLYDMAAAALNSCGDLREIHLVMPNKHRLLFDLSRFGLDNPDQIFVPTDEPSGYIEARVSN